ncbi:MAG: AzlC family ABC transporter permease [Rhizobiaceae bacterium]|nr:AzlC family ABC transporter permease [Rhizobiaceae bacterium]
MADPAPLPDHDDDITGERFRWYLRGFREVVSLPALILATSFVGFAALALEAGITLAQAVFMTGIVWALPAKVVLIGAIMAGNALPAAAFAVALSSVRLTPMVVALVPELKARGTRNWVLLLLSHFVAVTSWVIAMEKVREVPRGARTAWYGGVGSSLVILNMGVVTAVYLLAQDMPAPVSAALLILTPMYFLTSLWGSARERAGRVAMALGLVLGPLFALLTPEFSLLVTGLVGGTAAYLIHRFTAGRAGA